MKQFAANLESDLQELNRHMADHARTAESYFEGIYVRAEALKNKVEGAFEIISSEASVSLHSAYGYATIDTGT